MTVIEISRVLWQHGDLTHALLRVEEVEGQEAKRLPDVIPVLKQKGEENIKKAKEKIVWRTLHRTQAQKHRRQQYMCNEDCIFKAGMNSQELEDCMNY